jgi:integrase
MAKGFILLVKPQGGKLRRFDYRIDSKRKILALGSYPDVTLATAREKLEEARRLVADGIDPIENRKAKKADIEEQSANSFEAVAREWLALNASKWAENTHKRTKERLEQCLFPWLGSRPIAEISARELLAALNQTVARGRIDMASRIRADTGRIFRYAIIVTGKAERDPTADLIGALPSPRAKHRATLVEPKDVGALLRAIDGYDGTFVTRAVLKACPSGFFATGGTGAGRMGGV